jgi:GH25 family lysozyme M1 (1,4-beta-N-acetylmuramidase)
MQLVVTANKLNRRSSVPVSLTDKNIIGTVLKGFRFNGEEVKDVPNPSLGKWFRDLDNACYWGGGLVVEKAVTASPLTASTISNLPTNLPMDFQLGIDISHHNDKLDWNAIKAAGVAFCFIKISEGVGTRDKKAKEHSDNAKSIGLKIGYYHFCRPDTRNGGTIVGDATAEAAEALNVISTLQPPDLPLVLDLEDQLHWDTPLKRAGYLEWVQTFINSIERQPGMTALIYSRKNYLDDKLPNTHDLGNHKLWIANYSQKDCSRVVCPNGWGDWALWQFTESGSIGNSSKLDINILKDTSLLA